MFKFPYINRTTWLKTVLSFTTVVLMIFCLFQPITGLANGGTVIYNGDSGPFNIYMVISPSPPVPTVPAHITLLLTRKSTGQPVTGAVIVIEPEMPAMAMPALTKQRLLQQPSNPSQYEVDVPVNMDGIWRFKLLIADSRLGQTNIVAETKVEKPDLPWPIILAILVSLPTMAALTWFFLFRNRDDDDDDDDDVRKDVDDKDNFKKGIGEEKKKHDKQKNVPRAAKQAEVNKRKPKRHSNWKYFFEGRDQAVIAVRHR